MDRNLKTAQETAKSYYDKKARLRTFKVGDRVLILRSARKNKMEIHWDRPLDILDQLSETNYALKMPRRGQQIKIYHCNLMKPMLRGAVL